MPDPNEPSAPRLLVIDDDPVVLKLVKTVLARAQYSVVTAPSGADGLRQLTVEPFDCVITDAIMPVMSGYDVVKAIRKNSLFAALPVLMLTRKRHRQDVKHAVEAGVTDYVLKPIDEHLLLDKVELCLKKGGGKRHIFECALHGPQSVAEIGFDARVVSVSESDLALRVPFEMKTESLIHLRSRIFEEIGIPVPLLKLMRCVEAPVPSGETESAGLGWEARLAFVGVAEPDLRKIRTWLQRQEIQRRK